MSKADVAVAAVAPEQAALSREPRPARSGLTHQVNQISLWALQILGLWILNLAGVWIIKKTALPIPGNLIGMVLLYALLASGVVRLSWFEPAGSFLIRHLAFFFVPITVGLMNTGPLFERNGLGIIVTLVASAANRDRAGRRDIPDPAQIMAHRGYLMITRYAVALTVFGIALTAGAYLLSLAARRRYPSPLTTPVLFSTVIIIAVLLLSGISFADYQPAKSIMTSLLGPATVALAIPLYKNRQTFVRNLVPAGLGLIAGSLGTMIVALLLARFFRFVPVLASSIAIKSTTVPIAIEIARIVHGKPAVTAAMVVITRHARSEFRSLADGPLVDHRSGSSRAGARYDFARARYRPGRQRERVVRRHCRRRDGARRHMHVAGGTLDRPHSRLIID